MLIATGGRNASSGRARAEAEAFDRAANAASLARQERERVAWFFAHRLAAGRIRGRGGPSSSCASRSSPSAVFTVALALVSLTRS